MDGISLLEFELAYFKAADGTLIITSRRIPQEVTMEILANESQVKREDAEMERKMFKWTEQYFHGEWYLKTMIIDTYYILMF